MFRFVAPAGAAPDLSKILRGMRATLGPNGLMDEGLRAVRSQFQVRHAWGISSGRAALTLILRALGRLEPRRSIVAVPAYTCFTVAASVIRAGLKLYPVEIDPETLDFDFSELRSLPEGKVLCIVTSNLFGLMNDAASLCEIARAKGAFVVDDAAQAMGAFQDGQYAGMRGDAGFYSLGRGKALASLEGGLIVTNSSAIASAIEAETRDLPSASAAHSAWLGLEMLGYRILLAPRLYWIPNGLPFLKLGMTEFDPHFQLGPLPRLSMALLPAWLAELAEINEIRRRNAAALSRAIEHSALFRTPRPKGDCQPTYIRFPVIARDRGTRDAAVARLRAAGFGASSFYPSAICDIPDIEERMAPVDFHRAQAEALAQRLFTLPDHPLVSPADLERMVDILNRS
jgi:dTDP-4-amino-4,6-dideoxygalactose transaminase